MPGPLSDGLTRPDTPSPAEWRVLRAELEELRETLRSIEEGAADYILIVDCAGRIRFINKTVAGIERDSVPGTTVYDWVPASFHETMRASLARVAATGQPDGYETEYHGADGVRIFASRVGAIQRDGRVVAMTICASDVTEPRRLQAQLAEAQKMEAVGRLAGGVAHDFNNLLMVIAGQADLLRQRQEAPELDAIQDAVGQAAALTGHLLAFSRRAVVRPEAVSLAGAAERVAALLRRTLGPGVMLRVAPIDAGLAVRIDSQQLQQVLVNLVLNARDALCGGGSITLDAGAGEPALAWIAVSDDGAGIAPEVLPRIFEPFFSTKARGKGTGLGLATVASVVEQAGGRVDVSTGPGAGSRFQVSLPRCDAPADVRSTTSRAGAPATILLVEDEAAVRDLIERILTRAGHRVLAAGTPSQARRLFAEHGGQVELLLSDLMLPEMGGRELAAALREERPGLAVVFQSGYDPEAEVGGRSGGAPETFLTKPFTPDELLRAVSEVLGAQRR